MPQDPDTQIPPRATADVAPQRPAEPAPEARHNELLVSRTANGWIVRAPQPLGFHDIHITDSPAGLGKLMESWAYKQRFSAGHPEPASNPLNPAFVDPGRAVQREPNTGLAGVIARGHNIGPDSGFIGG